MKFTCTQENLKQGLTIASKLSQKNNQLPILENVCIKATSKGIQLISTNLEIAIQCSIRGKVDQEGEYTVPSKLLFDFITLQKPENILIDLHNESMFLSCGNVKTRIKGSPAGDFPLIPTIHDAQVYKFSTADLRLRLQSCLFAASLNDARPELAGVYISFYDKGIEENSCTMVATDSYRLSEVTTILSGGDKTPLSVIVPQKTVSEVVRVLQMFKDDAENVPTVEVHVANDQILFRYGSIDIISRIITGQYPNYKQIIPKTPISRIQVDRQEIIQALKINSLFTKQGVYDVMFQFKTKESILQIQSSNQISGDSQVEISCVVEGEDGVISLNYKYVMDGLQNMESKTVYIEFTDSQKPCVFLPSEKLEEGFMRYIVMPIRA